MPAKKDPNDYNYGIPCEDHLGNKYKNYKEMSEAYGISSELFQKRKARGWSVEKILTTPPRNYKWKTPFRNMGICMSEEEMKKYMAYMERDDYKAAEEYMRKLQRE